MASDIALQQIAAQATETATVRYVCPEEPGEWWSARHLALVAHDAAPDGDGTVAVTVVGDLSPLTEGLTEVHQRFPGEPPLPERRVQTLRVPHREVLHPVGAGDLGLLRMLRDNWRIANRMPRVVARAEGYALRHPWPPGCFVQGGVKHRLGKPGPDGPEALVVEGVFLEAFPTNPDTFLRAEAATFAEAEDVLWGRWTRITGCPSPTGSHEFETRGYRNGAGFCTHCGLFAVDVFDLAEIGSVCAVCGVGTYWVVAADGSLLRKEHAPRYRCLHGREFFETWDAEHCGCRPTHP